MKRIVCMAGVLAVFIAGALVSGQAGADDEGASIKSIMGALNKGPNSHLGKLKSQLKAESPDWPKIQTETKAFVTHGASLSKFDPPRGQASGYKSLATNFFNTSKQLDSAAQKKDVEAARAALSKLNSSCKECHAAHKPQ